MNEGTTSQSGRCAECGRPLLAGVCGECDTQLLYRFIQREIVVLVVLSALALVLFLVTRRVANSNRQMSRTDAAAWYLIGTQQLAAGVPGLAVGALQKASNAARDNPQYRIALAQALSANQQDDAARQVLLGLREVTPEDPSVNAQLARLEVRRSASAAATAYYQSALYGKWNTERLAARRALRIEFVQFLLSQKQNARALSELLVLSEDLPADTALQLETGRLYLRAGNPRRALEQFAAVLQKLHGHREALAGAGAAAFQLGDYRAARSYLARITEPDDSVRGQLELSEQVLLLDPTQARLPLQEKRRRMVSGLQWALARADSCALRSTRSEGDSLAVSALAGRTLLRTLERASIASVPELVEVALDLVGQLESRVPAECAEPTVADRALLLVARRAGAAR
jgi:tetratricopeptide (TPR) repeat protein